ncbi:MAG TPA: hypothetical protein PLD47_05510 [Aggregatilineales bacterium]|nr:hypothetical protein [Anaerolineales bacterium]HRE47163.1 hypothetical protein [Aggregatilineales bacterium]
MRRSIALLIMLCVAVAACNSGGTGGGTTGGSTIPTETPAGASVAPAAITWERAPNAVVVRLDRLIGEESELDRLNRLPACTLFGDGRVVWVNTIPPQGEELLEGYIEEVTFRTFLEFLIRDVQFYDIPDYAAQELPPAKDSAMEIISVVINGETRTIRSYKSWKNNAYVTILEHCRTLAQQPALFIPDGAWVTVYEIPREVDRAFDYWSPAAPFSLAEVAATKTAIWASDVAVRELWIKNRQTLSQLQWLEGDKSYRVALQVPLISRDAPPAPILPTPEPTPDNSPPLTPPPLATRG